MKTIRFVLAPVVVTLLACTGIFADADADSANDGDASDTGSSGPDDGVRQTGSCADYMACLEEADPDEYKQAKDEYAEDGSCWQSTRAQMQECDTECEEALNDLIEAEGEDVCDGAIDDTGDTGSSNDCSLDAGYWLFYLDWIEDTCGLSETGSEWAATVECDGGDLSIEFANLTVPISCESAGSNFTCVYEDGSYMLVVSGTATGGGSASTGTLQFDASGECFTYAEFEGARE